MPDRCREAAAIAAVVSTRWRNALLARGVTKGQCAEYAAAFEHRETDVALRMGAASVRVAKDVAGSKPPGHSR